MSNQETPLATEIIRTLKRIIYILIVVNILTIAGFLWYLSLPAEESVVNTQTTDEIDSSEVNQVIGGDFVGEGTADSNKN